MTGMDAVEKQVDAFNARDLEAFVTWYAPEAVIEDADGGVQMSGRDEIRTSYGKLFASRSDLHAEVPTRIRVGSYVVDEETVNGPADGDHNAVARAVARGPSSRTGRRVGPGFRNAP